MLMTFLLDLFSNIFWLTLCWTLLQEASLVQVPPQLLWEASQDFSGQQECIYICSLLFLFPYLCITLTFGVFLHSSHVGMVPKSWHFCKLVVCVWYKKHQREWLEIAVKISMLYFVLLNEIPAVDPPTCWSENLCESVFTLCVFIVKVLQALFDYFDVSSFLSDAFWLPFQFRDKVQRKTGICLWRVELAEKRFSSAPFLIGKSSL